MNSNLEFGIARMFGVAKMTIISANNFRIFPKLFPVVFVRSRDFLMRGNPEMEGHELSFLSVS